MCEAQKECPMTIVIHGAAVATVDADDTVFYDGAVVVVADRIEAIGASRDILARFPDAERIDAADKAVMPGFANVHTHLYMTLARGIYEDMSPAHKPPFGSGLSPLPLPALSPDEHRVFCQLGVLEAIRSGTTAILEDATEIETYVEDLAATGVRFLVTERAWDKAKGSIGDQSGFEVDRKLGERCLARIEALHHKRHGMADGRIRVGVSAWAPDMCSPELLRDLRTLQQKLDTIATIHLNQIWGEVAAVRSVRGRLPTEYLDEVGFLNDRLIAAHCRCMEPHEEQRLGKARVSVAFNSAIAARRGLSPRIADLEQSGCLIAMGSDNMAEDMVEVVRTGLFMERVRRQDGRLPTPEQVHRWATVNGYRAMGIADGGALVAGNKADLIMIDLQRAHLVPVMRVVSDYVHQGQGSDVEAVMVDGRWVMRGGKVLTMDEDAIVADAQRIGRSAWRRLFDSRPDLEVPKGFVPL
jgi:5-methylthioadenosine/S-adenosylhomocysteine deaminase